MPKYTIKYQQGLNILLDTVEANNTTEARYNFYMNKGGGVDILDIKEETKNENT